MAGICIAISTAAYLNCDSTITKALVSCFGFLMIFIFGFSLFSTKVGYALKKSRWYNFDLIIILVGNLIGSIVTGLIFMFALPPQAKSAAIVAVGMGLEKGALSQFILAFFCGMIICLANEVYNRLDDRTERMLASFVCIAAFVIPGFEHFLANAAVLAISGQWSGQAVLFLLLAVVGNAAGAIVLSTLKDYIGLDYED